MGEPLRIEAPNEELAHALMRRLGPFPTELGRSNGHCEVEIMLVGNPDRAIVDVLSSVDGWLAENDLETVRIHLDHRVYTLRPPHATR